MSRPAPRLHRVRVHAAARVWLATCETCGWREDRHKRAEADLIAAEHQREGR